MTPIQHISFHSPVAGNHLVVLGAVHGNEHCGTNAIRRAVAELESGTLLLTRGKVTFVPICNPAAYAAKVRFCERNLNRHFYPKTHPVFYEDALDNILCDILDTADSLLDIHSYQSAGGAFCFLGMGSQAEIDYARALGVEMFIYGWAEAFSKNASEEQRLASLGTTDYVRSNKRGGIAVTLECGQHDNDDAAIIGYHGIVRALQHFSMTPLLLHPVDTSAHYAVQMKHVFYKEKAGAFASPWKHGDSVNAGQVIARYDDGGVVTAPQDGILVLPKSETDHPLGAEWVYFGIKTQFPNV